MNDNNYLNGNNKIIVSSLHQIFIRYRFSRPNNDGNNDVFLPLSYDVEYLSFSIYNRWGERIFHTDDKYTAWNGGKNNNPLKMCQNGAYVFCIIVRDNQGISESYTGSVMLIADY